MNDEIKVIEKMEKAGFTEAQIDALYKYINFYVDSEDKWRDKKLKEEMENVKLELKYHKHLDGKVVIPYEVS